MTDTKTHRQFELFYSGLSGGYSVRNVIGGEEKDDDEYVKTVEISALLEEKQKTQTLVDQIYKVQCTGPNQKEVLKELYRLADLYDKNHRGENEMDM